LRPGTGQVKALLVIAGNPASCVPDQSKITSAPESLELLVVVDPYPTSTARRAHYVIAPTLQYEHPDLPYSIDGFNTYPDCWCRYTPAIMSPPRGSDVVDDWYVLWRLAAKLNIPLTLKGRTLDRDVAPTSDQLFEILLEGTITSLVELKNYPRGKIFSNEQWKVLPARPEALDNRFDTMPLDVAVEVDEYLASPTVSSRVHTHLLSSRRRRDFYNTIGQSLPKVRARNLRNPVHLTPADIAQLGLEEGMFVRIESDSGSLETVVEADAGVRPGVASISHGCSNLTGEVTDISRAEKDCVNVLIDSNAPRDSIQSQPRMSAIPVTIVPAGNRS
jgi:anaerobic selenocysteine-containing dehydrogenase